MTSFCRTRRGRGLRVLEEPDRWGPPVGEREEREGGKGGAGWAGRPVRLLRAWGFGGLRPTSSRLSLFFWSFLLFFFRKLFLL